MSCPKGKHYGDTYALSSAFFEQMHDFYHTWHSFRPKPPIKKGEFFILAMIIRLLDTNGQKVTVGMLAKAMHQSMPSTSQKINMLENSGYIERIGDAEDRRITYIQITPKGKAVAEESMQDFFDRVEKALQKVGEEKMNTLMETMQELIAAFENS